ncbi:hypothetical protein F2Q69_00039722 [Brassica cretica]|uniref:Uncharacterized protein n=1 Tax=Brassica cretica TaxID=69181 RepID=A0A8S9NPY2_BRACR|nr:hypothetical protein F2Q69_00039722 [Brassica cretica]
MRIIETDNERRLSRLSLLRIKLRDCVEVEKRSNSISDVKRLTLYELSTAKHFFRLLDGGEEASSQATTNGDHPTKRPPGVKAAKGVGGKRTKVDELGVSEFKGMWSIKEKDLAAEERLKKMVFRCLNSICFFGLCSSVMCLRSILLVRNALSLKLSCAGDNETMRERENETNDTDKSSHEVQEVTR